MRDIEKAVEQGKKVISKHPRAELSVLDFLALDEITKKESSTDGNDNYWFNMVCNAFYFGVAVGHRNK